MNFLIIKSVDGLEKVCVNKTIFLFETLIAFNWAEILKLNCSQLTFLPSIVGPWILELSYIDKTEAWTLALGAWLSDLEFFSILIGLPSLVFTRTFAKSNPSEIEVA